MASSSSVSDKRKRTLGLLASLGIDLPKQTKLSDEELHRRLGRAIKAAQSIPAIIPNPPLSLIPLSRWEPDPSTADELANLMRRYNLEEMSDIYVARQQGKQNAVDVYADPLHDVRQTLMGFALHWSKGVECCTMMDKDTKVSDIYIRVSISRVSSMLLFREHKILLMSRFWVFT